MFRRSRPTPPPTFRNLQLYHELTYNRRTQTTVAAMFGIGQGRVSQIARQVKAWVNRLVQARHHKHDPCLRFHLAIARERLRLHNAHVPVIDIFTTGEDENPRYLRRYVAVVDGVPLNTIEITEQPDFRLLDQAADAVSRLSQLEAIARLGPYANVPTQVHQTIHRHLQVGSSCRQEPAAVSPVLSTGSSTQTPSNPSPTTTKHPSTATENLARGVVEAPPISAATDDSPTTYA